jgi:hypothetical protein
MDAALAHSKSPVKGARLLLAHCAVLDDDRRAPAQKRLRAALGHELANLLVSALAPGRGGRYRDVA